MLRIHCLGLLIVKTLTNALHVLQKNKVNVILKQSRVLTTNHCFLKMKTMVTSTLTSRGCVYLVKYFLYKLCVYFTLLSGTEEIVL